MTTLNQILEVLKDLDKLAVQLREKGYTGEAIRISDCAREINEMRVELKNWIEEY